MESKKHIKGHYVRNHVILSGLSVADDCAALTWYDGQSQKSILNEQQEIEIHAAVSVS